jgi:hypothetical protein
MLALQQCDALVAVLGTEALNYAAAVLLSVGRELLPVIRTVIIDHKRIDGAGQRPTRTDLNMGQARKSRSIGCHEFLRTGQARKRHRLATAAPEIVAHAFVLTTAVREGVDVFQLDARHSFVPLVALGEHLVAILHHQDDPAVPADLYPLHVGPGFPRGA